MTTVLIGIDDTDNKDSPGTGQLARRVSAEIARFGGIPLGTTRHQFFVDPQIPYTGHNRGICVATDWPGPLSELEFVFDLVQQWSADGSDPGVCIVEPANVTPAIIAWGESAMTTVLTMDACRALSQRNRLDLRALGGTGQGIIGALGSVGLRVGGNHGRFVDMPGLRDLGETVTAEQLAAMNIHVVHETPLTTHSSGSGLEPPADARYKSLGWVRPRLHGGKAVLSMEWSFDHDAWIPVERKTIHPME